MTFSRRKEVLSVAREFSAIVVEDDPYRLLYFNEKPPPPSFLALSYVPILVCEILNH